MAQNSFRLPAGSQGAHPVRQFGAAGLAAAVGIASACGAVPIEFPATHFTGLMDLMGEWPIGEPMISGPLIQQPTLNRSSST